MLVKAGAETQGRREHADRALRRLTLRGLGLVDADLFLQHIVTAVLRSADCGARSRTCQVVVPGRSQALDPVLKARPGRSQALDPVLKARPGRSQALDQMLKARPGRSQALDQVLKALPGRSQALDPVLKARPGRSQALDQVLKARPGRSQALEPVLKARPGRSQALEPVRKAHPHRDGQGCLCLPKARYLVIAFACHQGPSVGSALS